MATKVTYSYARQNLASLLDQVAENREPVYVSRRDHDDVVILSEAEYRSVEETAHLLRSPENARRLFQALQRALDSDASPGSVSELRREVGLDDAAG